MKIKKIKIPYNDFSEENKAFINEVIYRTQSALISLDLMLSFKYRKPKSIDEAHEFESIRYITARFAILEIMTLLDGRGDLSLKMDTNKGISVPQRDKLRKFLSSLDDSDFMIVYARLCKLFAKNASLIEKMIRTRHENIAHAKVSSYRKDKRYLSSYKFPRTKFIKFVYDLHEIFAGVVFGYYSNVIEK